MCSLDELSNIGGVFSCSFNPPLMALGDCATDGRRTEAATVLGDPVKACRVDLRGLVFTIFMCSRYCWDNMSNKDIFNKILPGDVRLEKWRNVVMLILQSNAGMESESRATKAPFVGLRFASLRFERPRDRVSLMICINLVI